MVWYGLVWSVVYGSRFRGVATELQHQTSKVRVIILSISLLMAALLKDIQSFKEKGNLKSVDTIVTTASGKRVWLTYVRVTSV